MKLWEIVQVMNRPATATLLVHVSGVVLMVGLASLMSLEVFAQDEAAADDSDAPAVEVTIPRVDAAARNFQTVFPYCPGSP